MVLTVLYVPNSLEDQILVLPVLCVPNSFSSGPRGILQGTSKTKSCVPEVRSTPS